jgi:hypothetical protein
MIICAERKPKIEIAISAKNHDIVTYIIGFLIKSFAAKVIVNMTPNK